MREVVDELRAYLAWANESGLQNLASGVAPRASSAAMKPATLEQVREQMGECTLCKLHKGRHNIVFGVGNPRAKLIFVGEAPGEDEDLQGFPFVGKAGQLLTKMIEAMGRKRDAGYICTTAMRRRPANANT